MTGDYQTLNHPLLTMIREMLEDYHPDLFDDVALAIYEEEIYDPRSED